MWCRCTFDDSEYIALFAVQFVPLADIFRVAAGTRVAHGGGHHQVQDGDRPDHPEGRRLL